MRKILLVLVSFLTMYAAQAQLTDTDRNAAVRLVTSHQKELGLSVDDLNNYIVSSSYEDKVVNIRYVYLLQTYKGIIVSKQMQVLSFRNDKLLSKSGGRIDYIDQKVDVKSGVPSLSAQSAVMAAIADRKLSAKTGAMVLKSTADGQKITFNDMGISHENITAQLMWVPDPVGKEVHLAWQVYIIPTTSSDYWLVRVNATNSSVIEVDNLTVYDNWGTPASKENDNTLNSIEESQNVKYAATSGTMLDLKKITALSNARSSSPSVVNASAYRVIPFPAESPQAAGGAPALVNDPWTAAPGNATTLKWHTGLGGIDYNYTRGNNVWAYEDRTSPDGGDESNSAHSTTTSDPLSFDFVPNFSVAPTQTTPVQNQQFAITNLFYWNNILHDVMYQYGFTEAAANFQEDNQGRGGVGNDYVKAEAQDGSGTNNANFSTPADGGKGRMQMYLFTINSPSPSKDGDLDNGIVVHEFGHGISNRLTGGGSGACLSTTQSGGMGEGWGDYYALMFTQNWATSTNSTGFTTPRPTGTYALSNVNYFPASPPNSGIRNYAYCTNMAVNPLTYANYGVAPIGTEVHNIGEIWCAALWDMTWNIIQQENSINPNLYNVAGGGGNTIAMKLVTEGLKLQPCSPGFIDGRNAIIQADINLYGGVHVCAIKEAFRRRGMGEGATQNPVVASFIGEAISISLLQNGVISTPEQQNIAYTNRAVTSPCGAIANYMIRDTLPLNVTFVSADNGGTYNAGNRVVSWVVNQAANTTVDYNFVVNINAGAYYPGINLINESVAGATIPASFTAASTTSTQWVVSNAQSHSPTNSFFTADIAVVSDQTLATTASFAIPASPPQLSFWHYYNSESTFDGGVVEISTNGGTSWADIGAANYVQNGYNSTIPTIYSSPIGGRQAFSGNSSSFIKSIVNMLPYANQADVKLRWRFASDNGVAGTGWYVDDISLSDIARVNMRSSLFNASDIRTGFSDTTMEITQPVCVPPTISAVNVTSVVCPSTTGSIVVDATASGAMEYSVDNGSSWQSSNTFNGLAIGNYTVKVRLQNNPTCEATYALNPVEILTAPSIIISSIISNPATCSVATGSINVSASSVNGNVEYSVDGTNWFPQGTAISGLVPATYQIQARLTAFTSCVLNAGTATVNPSLAKPEFNTLQATFPSCLVPTGAVSGTASSPDGAVEISLDGTTWYPSGHVFNGLIPGTYILQARLILNPDCATNSTPVFVPGTPGLPVFGTVTVTDASCTVPTGSITAAASSGSELVEVSVDGTTWYPSGTTISGLAPGTYTVSSRLQSQPVCIQVYGTAVVINTVSSIPATPGPVEGLTNVCRFIDTDIALTYSVPAVAGATSYNWTVPPTVTLVSGQGTNSITVFINANFLSNVNRMFRVTASNACGTSEERLFWLVAQLPTTPSAITGPTNACTLLGSSAVYSVPAVASASSYIWTAQAGTTIVPAGAGVLGNSVTISFPLGFTSSAISVTAVNDCGTSGSRSLNIVRSNPTTPSLMSGPTNVCANIAPDGTAANYSVPVLANASAYTWTVPAGVTDLAGQGTNAISFTYPAGFTGGSLSVTAMNGCGTSAARNLAVTKLNPATPSPIDVIQTQFCGAPAGRVFTYTLASLPVNATSILWTVPTGSGAAIVNGQGTTSITVTYPDASVNGTVTAQAIANCATSTVRSVSVKLPACPPPTFAGSNKGNYTSSSEKAKSIEIAESTFNIVVSPNPTVTDFKLQVLTAGKEEVIITVIDNVGRADKFFRVMPNQVVSFGSELKAGVYLVRARQGNQEKTIKVIKF